MIYVIDGYRVRDGVIIPRGYYEDDAPELFGQRDYLLANGHAREAQPGDVVIDQAAADTLSFEDYDGDLLKVHQGYRVGEGHIINPGLYRPDDPALAGRADYLVENHYATWLKREPPVLPPEAPKPNLSRMKVNELKALAAEHGIEIPDDALKADIVALLEAAPIDPLDEE